MTTDGLAYANFRARFFESRLEFDKALGCFEKALGYSELQQNSEDLSSVLYHLALLNFLAGDDRAATRYAHHCLASAPGHKIAQSVLHWCEAHHPLDIRSKVLLGQLHNRPIPLVQALKNRTTLDSHRPKNTEKAWRENDRRLAELQDIHKGQRAFVLGNGPSLSCTDLDKLKGEITFASNKIYLAFEQTDWRPTYYSVVDHLVMRNNQEEINKLTGPVKLFPFYLDCCPPPSENQLIFFDVVEDYFPGEPGFGTDFYHGLYWGATVTYTMIQIAFIMGIRELYLLGVDFSFSVPSRKDRDGKLISTGERNHFHPDYRPEGELWNLPDLHFQKVAFQKAKKAFETAGGAIFNATRGGKLEIFTRAGLDSIL